MSGSNVIYYGLLFLAALIGFLVRKFLVPGANEILFALDPDGLDGLSKWAVKFCRAAKNMIDGLQTGEDRRGWVLSQISDLCERYHIDLTDEQKRALLEAAYDEMQAQDSDIVRILPDPVRVWPEEADDGK